MIPTRLGRIAATTLLATSVAVAIPAQSASAAKSPVYGWPETCNSWLEYGQFLYFNACGPSAKIPNWGTTVELLTFGGDWRQVCVKNKFIARWDRGGYAGHRISSFTYCDWKKSSPAHRQPSS